MHAYHLDLCTHFNVVMLLWHTRAMIICTRRVSCIIQGLNPPQHLGPSKQGPLHSPLVCSTKARLPCSCWMLGRPCCCQLQLCLQVAARTASKSRAGAKDSDHTFSFKSPHVRSAWHDGLQTWQIMQTLAGLSSSKVTLQVHVNLISLFKPQAIMAYGCGTTAGKVC